MTERPRLTVIGTGYLGATHAVCMAELGYEVLGLDVDEAKIAGAATGEVPFFEPGLPSCCAKHIDSGRLRFTTDYAEAAEFGDVHFICVGTPQKTGQYAADMTLRRRPRSARSRRTCTGRRWSSASRRCRPAPRSGWPSVLADAGPEPTEVELAWNPEFLREGFAVEDTLRPDRLVFGVHSDWAEQALR